MGRRLFRVRATETGPEHSRFRPRFREKSEMGITTAQPHPAGRWPQKMSDADCMRRYPINRIFQQPFLATGKSFATKIPTVTARIRG